jgi:tetratricopeptide (TPR) repeat protein
MTDSSTATTSNTNNSTLTNTENAYAAFVSLWQRLKKRKLLRKPPYREASEEYARVGKALRRESARAHTPVPHLYAAFCYHAVARCQAALGVRDKQASSNLHAGDTLFLNECDDVALGVEWEQYVPEALQCYHLAVQIYCDAQLPAMAAAALVEMAESLQALNRNYAASRAYQQASALLGNGVLAVQLLREAAECETQQHEYQRACATIVQAIDLAERMPTLHHSLPHAHAVSDLLPSFPVVPATLVELRTTLLLLYVLQGQYNDASVVLSRLVADMAGDDTAAPLRLRADDAQTGGGGASTGAAEMLEHLHAVIETCRERDVILLHELYRNTLQTRLNAKQAQLLDLILCEME